MRYAFDLRVGGYLRAANGREPALFYPMFRQNEIVFNPTMVYASKFLNVPRMLITRFGYPKLRISLFFARFILPSVIRRTIETVDTYYTRISKSKKQEDEKGEVKFLQGQVTKACR